MPKVTLTDVVGLPDPMLNDNFELIFPRIPGSNDDGRNFRLQCKSGVKPGMTIQEVEIELFGHKVKHAGRKTFSGTMSVSFVESRDGRIITSLEDWAESVRGTDSQHGTFKEEYAITATLVIYDQTGDAALTYTIYGVWPTEVPEYTFDGSGGSNITADCTFSYDYYERE